MSTPPLHTNEGDEELELDNRIQALPQELQDTILDFVLIAGVKCIEKRIHDSPPWQISVNSRTRKFVALEFYETASFIVPERSIVAGESPYIYLVT